MSRALHERIKNLIIFILIVSGILQVGILLGYQSQWTPTNFIWGLINRPPQISDEEAISRLFTPSRLILSNGVILYIIHKEDDVYQKLWDETQNDLRSLANGTVSLKSSNENWDDLILKKGIIIDVGYPMTPELLKWFLDVPKMNMDIPDILKVMINPDIMDPDTGVIYICDSNEKVYESGTFTFGPELNFENVYASVSGNERYRSYTTLKGANIADTLKAPGDILFVNSPPKYWPYYEYRDTIPERAEKDDEFARDVLGTEKDRYIISRNRDMTQYEYGNNIYRFYADGCLTYQNLDEADTSIKEGMGSALLNAYKFIDKINQLSDSAADIMLTNIEPDKVNQGIYNISFDYYLNGMPVKFGPDVRAGNGDQLAHAINIQADGKKVLKCEWLLKDFAQSAKGNYNDRFVELMNTTKHGYDKIKINNVITGYFIKSAGDQKLMPMMLIELKDKSMVEIEMPVEKGD